MRKYKTYTDEDIIRNVAIVTSLHALLRKLNLVAAGGSFYTMKRHLQRLNLDTSHWTGQAWNKNQQLKDWSEYFKSGHFKPHLIKLRGNRCEDCRRITWKKQAIKLEIHHIDGDRTNNQYENLQLLCPNCHSLTKTWRKKKAPA